MTSVSPLTSTRRPRRAAVASQPQPQAAQAAAAGTARTVPTAFFGAGPRKAVKEMDARERFSTLQDRFDANATKNVDVRFQFELSGKGGGTWYVEIKKGKLTVKEGTGPNPTATLKASAEDYIKIANGEMNKMMAFLRGKLKVDGDKDAIKKFDSYFKS